MTPSMDEIYAAMDATWPPARIWQDGPLTLREGQGGGGRVSSATQDQPVVDADIDAAETAMRAIDQTPRFQIRAGHDDLDALLAARGYDPLDETVVYAAPITKLMDISIPRVTTFCVWEPLAIMNEIWAKGGIGPARLNVMARAKTKTGILSRWNEKPAGVAFAAVHNHICMVHAVEVLAHQRRMGVAVWMMRQAAFWGQSQGADTIALMTTRANVGANALYVGLGFNEVGGYHYRHLPKG
ncbi:MAG: ribosomal protein S18 acetylase RimI-like enzyme [Ascidiaceihabitans sp.]|jgi:ribosomal protein S18 acetylase RimI-like enzyme